MDNGGKAADLFELAILAEKKAQAIYYGLSELFSHMPRVSEFWLDMMEDEVEHEAELLRVFDSLTEGQRETPVDPALMKKADEAISGLSVERVLDAVDNLDDAYELAYRLEHSEIVAVFTFLVKEFVPSKDRHEFALKLINSHVSKLDIFSKVVGDASWRRGIRSRTQG